MATLSVAVLISGGGTTLKNLLAWQSRGDLSVDFSIVVSSRSDAKGIEYARAAGIPVKVISKRDFPTAEEHRDAVFSTLRAHGAHLVVMGGYLEHLLIPDDFVNRVVNIHPSLIPAFCGRGYYGERVHSKVIESGAKITGCTVHFVDNEYDHGPIIAQRACQVLEVDSPESLQRRVFELECQIYPEAIEAIARNRVSVEGRRVHVRGII